MTDSRWISTAIIAIVLLATLRLREGGAPLPAEALALLTAAPARFALVAFAPSRISDLAARATWALFR